MTAWYVYGVVGSDAAPPRGTYLIERGPLAAVAAEVSLADFGEDVLPGHLNDRRWLEEKAFAHESILQAFIGITPVVPLRFGTIYRDLGDVRTMLDERSGYFAGVLERVRGCVELGVKAWFDPQRVAAPPAADGRAYLERRRGELSSAREAAAAASSAHARLLQVAVDGVVNRPQARELSGRDEQMLLNAAYLVVDGDTRLAEELAQLAEEHAQHGLTFELTGPWPPYNFAEEEEA